MRKYYTRYAYATAIIIAYIFPIKVGSVVNLRFAATVVDAINSYAY